MNVINIGPLVLATDKAIIILTIAVFLLLLDKMDEKIAGLGKWSFLTILFGFIGARFYYAFLNFDFYRENLLSIFYFWQPGYHKMAGLIVAIIYTAITIFIYGMDKLKNDFLYNSKQVFIIVLLSFITLWVLIFMPDINQVDKTNTKPLPTIQLQKLDGSFLDLQKTYPNRPVILSLWASWCPTCRREIKQLTKNSTDLPILFVNQGEDVISVQNYLRENNLQKDKIILDKTSSISRMFNVKGYPSTLIFDKDAKLIYAKMGEVSLPELKDLLEGIENGK